MQSGWIATVVGVVALLGCAATANAQGTTPDNQTVVRRVVNVVSGGEVRLDFVTSINEDCSPVLPIPTVRLSDAPLHGTFVAIVSREVV
ncbi:hypothetical protein EYW49_20985 [Siculibacillus lacustris]|uniref:Uncharacterized protein n=1 Tax=Siculibacillus lacustris TaxID=1549641 RepID=A0A4Q9VE45_9HYPH|nr:hypothetical protein [Siculibacillus lacustris]TBW33002.1 hypothetical protein EYW49_20985 [Siculibacillus lacustris]